MLNMEYGRVLLFIILTFVGSRVLGSDADNVRHEGSRVRIRKLLPKYFVNVKVNAFREKEVRVGYEKVIAIETSLINKEYPELNMAIRQASDGKRFVQYVLQNGEIKECDFTKDVEQIRTFVDDFIDSVDFESEEFGDVLKAFSDETNISDKETVLAHKYYSTERPPEEFINLLDIREQRLKCKEFMKMAKSIARTEARLLKHGEYLNPNDSETNNFNEVVSAKRKELSDLDGRVIMSGKLAHHLNKRSTEPIERARTKRSAFDFNSVLIFPGTKWCGKGDLATCFDDLGTDRELDVCCRDHDCCQYVIPPFSYGFGVFNYRFHSLLHCECDQRFRGCLKESPSSTANMIGKIYFNILGSKCFEFKETEVCAERAWYGYCRRYETQVTAEVKKQQAFYDACASRNETSTGTGSSSVTPPTTTATTTTTTTTTVSNESGET